MAVERITDYTRRIWTGLATDAPDPDMQAGDVIYYMDTSTCSIIIGIPAPGSIDTEDLPDIGGGGGGGGGLYELLASGSYVQASDLGSVDLEIPVSVSGVAVEYYVATAPTTSIAQTYAWYRTRSRPEITEIPRLTSLAMHNAGGSAAYYNSTIVNGYPLATYVDSFTNPTMLTCRRYSNSAPIRSGTYTWYVWGYRT